MPLNQAGDVPGESTNTGNDETQMQTGQSTHHLNSLERNPTINRLTIGDDSGKIVPSDLWSAAYREAIENFEEGIDIAMLGGKNAVQLFRELQETGKEVAHESAFLRGVSFLHSLEIPLERFKLLIDLASPLATCEPTATTVVGVLRSVTVVSLV